MASALEPVTVLATATATTPASVTLAEHVPAPVMVSASATALAPVTATATARVTVSSLATASIMATVMARKHVPVTITQPANIRRKPIKKEEIQACMNFFEKEKYNFNTKLPTGGPGFDKLLGLLSDKIPVRSQVKLQFNNWQNKRFKFYGT